MKHNLSNKTLEELEVTKAIWLKDNEIFLHDLTLAVLGSGENFIAAHREYKQIECGKYRFITRKVTDTYDPAKKQWREYAFVSAWVGAKRVAMYTFFLDPDYGKWNGDSFCVPGDWMQVAEQIITEQDKTSVVLAAVIVEQERQDMLTLLLDGIEV